MGFTRAELEASRGRSVPDLLGSDLRLLFVGINPGLWTAAAQAHFAKRGNRFFPALHAAGLTDAVIDASAGFREEDVDLLTGMGIGITNIVNRATARAEELSAEELREGGRELDHKVAVLKPVVVVILGLTAYRISFTRPRASNGWQSETLADARLMVAGNPSGLNAHQTVASLGEMFREAAAAAGVPMNPG
jgi:TDG/mug DNA glycosylase family protein